MKDQNWKLQTTSSIKTRGQQLQTELGTIWQKIIDQHCPWYLGLTPSRWYCPELLQSGTTAFIGIPFQFSSVIGLLYSLSEKLYFLHLTLLLRWLRFVSLEAEGKQYKMLKQVYATKACTLQVCSKWLNSLKAKKPWTLVDHNKLLCRFVILPKFKL